MGVPESLEPNSVILLRSKCLSRIKIKGQMLDIHFSSDPTPFVCVLKPRSEKVIGLMHDFAANWN